MESWWRWLYDTDLAVAMRENEVLFPWIEAIHVVALTVVLGAIAVLDLRLLGLASRARSLPKLLRDVLPITWAAFVVAAITGVLLFASNAVAYAHNTCFQWKVFLLGLIGLNAAVFHALVEPSLARWDPSRALPTRARLSGALSITLWIGVTALGRWIGFTINAL
ncbi:MAG: DUF6644 family protein [Polyangiales bacterium]